MWGYFSPNCDVELHDYKPIGDRGSVLKDDIWDTYSGEEHLRVYVPARLSSGEDSVQIMDSKGEYQSTNTVIYINIEDLPIDENTDKPISPQSIGLEDQLVVYAYATELDDDGIKMRVKKVEHKRDLSGYISVIKLYVI